MLKGKSALVTGSTSGIGLGIAEGLAREGVNVMLNGFGDAAEIEKIRAGLEAKFKVKVLYDGADMSKPEQIEAMMKRAADAFGGVDILVINASIEILEDWQAISRAHFDRQIQVNLWATLALLQELMATASIMGRS